VKEMASGVARTLVEQIDHLSKIASDFSQFANIGNPKKEVFDHPISGPLMRGMHHIPVDRDAGLASYRQALAALKDGEVVGIFPEATISRSFTLGGAGIAFTAGAGVTSEGADMARP